jgi:hypothetical protein
MKARVHVYKDPSSLQPGWTREVTWTSPDGDEEHGTYRYGYRSRTWALVTGHVHAFLGVPGRASDV